MPVLQSKEARRRRVLMPLFILAAIALLVWLMLPGRGQSGITGSGSTLAQPLIQQAARDYRDAAAADNPERVKQTGRDWVLNGSGIDYEAIGSLGGILRLSDPEVDFAIADYPLTAAALSEKRVEQFPIAVGAIAIVANLDLPQGTALRLDAPTLADIFRGAVTTWQDPAITVANPGLELPDAPITSVHRTDGSGSTLGLTTWLSAHSADFRSAPGAGQSLTWPAGTDAERSSGMISTLQQTAGSIGYVELGQAIRAGLRPVAVAAQGDDFVTPSSASMSAAVAGANWSGARGYVDGVAMAEDPSAYPLTVPIYALVRAEDGAERERERALRFLRFIVDDYDGQAEDLGYLPLPETGATAVKDHWHATWGISL